jgi:hypothetical protein
LTITAAPAPEHHSSRLLSAQALQQGSSKAEGGAVTVAADDFMQPTATQAAPGQRLVDRGIAEADPRISRFITMIQSAQPLAQIGEDERHRDDGRSLSHGAKPVQANPSQSTTDADRSNTAGMP